MKVDKGQIILYMILSAALSSAIFWFVADQKTIEVDKNCQIKCEQICTDICQGRDK